MTIKTCYCGKEIEQGPGNIYWDHTDGSPRQCYPHEEEWSAEPEDGPHFFSEKRLTEEEVDKLANVAQIYVDAFTAEDRFTLLEVMALTKVKKILEKLGRNQEWDR